MKNTNKKILIASVIAIILAVTCIVGTFAYLAVKTPTVTNTFTSGNITLTISETGATGTTDLSKSYKIIPGAELSKDPKLTVGAGSEDCWVFVKVQKSDNFDATNVFEFTVDDTVWTQVPDADGVYYKEVSATDVAESGAELVILKDNKVTVKDTATAEQMAAATNSTLSFVGYAIQKDAADTAAAAWTEASKLG